MVTNESFLSHQVSSGSKYTQLPKEMQERLTSFIFLQKLALAVSQNNALKDLFLFVTPQKSSSKVVYSDFKSWSTPKLESSDGHHNERRTSGAASTSQS